MGESEREGERSSLMKEWGGVGSRGYIYRGGGEY